MFLRNSNDYNNKNNIRKLRLLNGLTQKELADLVNVRRETIIRLERGLNDPSLKLAMDISEVFKESVYDVFNYKKQY